ncbi:hypothetical protein BH10BAC3_BH10BAC3_24520 [soil metagenome]
MERTEKNTGINWLIFFISFAAMMAMLLVTDYGQWFWLLLPIVCTQFAKAMDIM